MGQVTGRNMGGIGQAFNRARNAQQSQQPRSGRKFNRPQQPTGGSGGIADMVRRAQARQQQQPQQPPTSGGFNPLGNAGASMNKQPTMGSGPKLSAPPQPIMGGPMGAGLGGGGIAGSTGGAHAGPRANPGSAQLTGGLKPMPAATTQPVRPAPQARNRAYARMLGGRGMPRGRGRF